MLIQTPSERSCARIRDPRGSPGPNTSSRVEASNAAVPRPLQLHDGRHGRRCSASHRTGALQRVKWRSQLAATSWASGTPSASSTPCFSWRRPTTRRRRRWPWPSAPAERCRTSRPPFCSTWTKPRTRCGRPLQQRTGRQVHRALGRLIGEAASEQSVAGYASRCCGRQIRRSGQITRRCRLSRNAALARRRTGVSVPAMAQEVQAVDRRADPFALIHHGPRAGGTGCWLRRGVHRTDEVPPRCGPVASRALQLRCRPAVLGQRYRRSSSRSTPRQRATRASNLRTRSSAA